MTEVLIELRSLNIPLGLVTDLTTQIQFRKLVYFRIDRYFDCVVTSEEAGSDKSGLAPFHLIADKMNLSPQTRVWFIGDNECDLLGSKQVLNALPFQKWIKDKPTIRYKDAAVAFIHFKDLLERLKPWKR